MGQIKRGERKSTPLLLDLIDGLAPESYHWGLDAGFGFAVENWFRSHHPRGVVYEKQVRFALGARRARLIV